MSTFLAKISPAGELATYRLVIASDADEAYDKALNYAINLFGGVVSVEILDDIL